MGFIKVFPGLLIFIMASTLIGMEDNNQVLSKCADDYNVVVSKLGAYDITSQENNCFTIEKDGRILTINLNAMIGKSPLLSFVSVMMRFSVTSTSDISNPNQNHLTFMSGKSITDIDYSFPNEISENDGQTIIRNPSGGSLKPYQLQELSSSKLLILNICGEVVEVPSFVINRWQEFIKSNPLQ